MDGVDWGVVIPAVIEGIIKILTVIGAIYAAFQSRRTHTIVNSQRTTMLEHIAIQDDTIKAQNAAIETLTKASGKAS